MIPRRGKLHRNSIVWEERGATITDQHKNKSLFAFLPRVRGQDDATIMSGSWICGHSQLPVILAGAWKLGNSYLDCPKVTKSICQHLYSSLNTLYPHKPRHKNDNLPYLRGLHTPHFLGRHQLLLKSLLPTKKWSNFSSLVRIKQDIINSIKNNNNKTDFKKGLGFIVRMNLSFPVCPFP